MAKMDGVRVRDYWSAEVDALLHTYLQFERLVPSPDHAGAAHAGEDGRFVEDLVREYLRRFLPRGLEVLTGFILRPAVKTGRDGRERVDEVDRHSGQLDILIVDTANYPVFQRFGDSVVVPPEGVIAVISVKKHLRDGDIAGELPKLRLAAELCRTLRAEPETGAMRGPFLALVSVKSLIEKVETPTEAWIFTRVREAYNTSSVPEFDDLVGFIGALQTWSIFKARPPDDRAKAKFVHFSHADDEKHLGLQLILSGILSVFYDEARSTIRRPGFTGFTSNRPHDKTLGHISCSGKAP